MTPDDLFARIADPTRRGLPPVANWHPDHTGDSRMRIDAQGRWFHDGGEIKRPAMVRVFSTILRRDPDGFFLVTPVEKLSIEVDDAPFLAIDMDVRGEGVQQELAFATNTEDLVIAGTDHPVRVDVGEGGAPKPYVEVRDGLDALIARSVYYRLADLAVEKLGQHGVWSAGSFFSLVPEVTI